MNMKIACTHRSRLRGLIGRSAFDGVLLLVPCRDVHTFGMKRDIDIAFLDSDGAVLESHRDVGPGKRLRCPSATATVERFSADAPWFEPGDFVHRTTLDGELRPASHGRHVGERGLR